MKKLTGESMNITEENLKAMQQLFPEAFEEGKIDFDVLRQLLGDFVDDEQERYSFKWNGKGKALRLSQTPSMGTLRPCKEESKDWDNTENLYIEGDNMEVLKLLQKSYYGKVKMIYIDPPYNTGGDFVYKDNFHDNIQNYKEITGQVDGEGNKIDTNTESNGRFHTDWLNMMYPRLRLARNLLSDDGVIFISIDDNEQDNLKKICDDVFGESNRIATISWKRKKEISNDSKNVAIQGEYLLVIGKSDFTILDLEPISKEYIDKSYREPTPEFPIGKWRPVPLTVSKGLSGGGYTYEVTTPSGAKHTRLWAYPKISYQKLVDDGKVYFGKDGNGIPQRVMYASESKGQPVSNYWDNTATNKEGKKAIIDLLGDNYFDTPKPIQLVKRMMQLATQTNSIILDFFSGSATTAHAVMQLNAEDGGNRKFIMVQLPEPTDEKSKAYKAGYKNICEIGKERIRRAGEKIKAEAGEKAADLDIGFKVFKLDSSNLQKWNPQPDDLVMTLQQATDNFLPDRTEQDVLYEIMLKMGLDLTCQIEEEQAAGETVYIIGGGALMICLGRNITTAVAEAVVKLHEEYESELWQVVFRDTGFASDMDKTNVKETLKAAGLDEDSFVCV